MKKLVAAVTMAYNETHKIKRWVSHYTAQLGSPDQLYILDHGSDDGSVSSLKGVNIIDVPRLPNFNQAWRADLVSKFCNSLLQDYHYVIYSDTDELLACDPAKFRSLSDYVERCEDPCNTALGYEVLHDVENEGALNDGPIFQQRSKLQFVASMCKPALTSGETAWIQGFHYSTLQPKYGDLFLFHLRYADVAQGKQRLAVTRSIERPDKKNLALDHQKISDDMFQSWIKAWLRQPTYHENIDLTNPRIKSYIDDFVYKRGSDGLYHFDYSFRSAEIYVCPPRFAETI